MAAKQKKLVKVPKDHPYPYYRRAGLVLQPGDNIVEVDEKQLASLTADSKLLVGEPPPAPEKPADAKPGEGAQGQGGKPGAGK
jgi:FluMu-like protein